MQRTSSRRSPPTSTNGRAKGLRQRSGWPRTGPSSIATTTLTAWTDAMSPQLLQRAVYAFLGTCKEGGATVDAVAAALRDAIPALSHPATSGPWPHAGHLPARGMEARQGRDPQGLDGEATTARPEGTRPEAS